MHYLLENDEHQRALFRGKAEQISKCREYCKMIAVMDMFLYHFPDHPFSSARISTMVTRNIECVAITGFSHISLISTVSETIIAEYVLNATIKNQIMAAFINGQELGNQNSYAKYLLDLELCKKSPYSATSSAGLHTWLHTIGCILGSPRSRNGAYVLCPNSRVIFLTGCVTGLMFEKRTKVELQFGANQRTTAAIIADRARRDEQEEEENPAGNVLGDGSPGAI